MYPGHYAVGLALQSRQKRDSTAVLLYFLIGAQLTDLLWTAFTIAGIEGGHSMGSMVHHQPILPYSHSLLMHVVWALLFGVLGWILFRRDRRIAVLGAANVLIHFVFDWAVEDMPLLPVSEIMVPGPGLYDMPVAASFVAEAAIIVVAWGLYRRRLRAGERCHNPKGVWGTLAILLLLHTLLYGPSFQNAPAVDLWAEPTAVLPYTFFLTLGIVVLTATHRWTTRGASPKDGSA